ncbi:MAG: hypothetical protein QM642_03280 [Edaphocola sp.]
MKQYIVAIIALMLTISSCDKKQKGTFTVKGRLLQDCSGQGISGRVISAWDFTKFGHGAQEIGTTSTDSNGYFELVCGYYGGHSIEIKGLPGCSPYDIYSVPGKMCNNGQFFKFKSTNAIPASTQHTLPCLPPISIPNLLVDKVGGRGRVNKNAQNFRCAV